MFQTSVHQWYITKKQERRSCAFRGKKSKIITYAERHTIKLAKTIYDLILKNAQLNKQIELQCLENAINKEKYRWLAHDGRQYILYNKHDNYRTCISFDTTKNKISLLLCYNEIAIRNNNRRMYFDNLCVNIETMNEALMENNENISKNILNFQSFIDACLKTGSQDIVIFRKKTEDEKEKDNGQNFWLKSGDLIKEKITFLEFLDKYCKNFYLYFTQEQKNKIDALRKQSPQQEPNNTINMNNENDLFDIQIDNNNNLSQAEFDKLKQDLMPQSKTDNLMLCNEQMVKSDDNHNNKISLFGLGCYNISRYNISPEERNHHPCGGCFGDL